MMKISIVSLVCTAALGSLVGCATELDDPETATTSSDVTEHANNWVAVPVLDFRSCDSPSGCLIGGMSRCVVMWVDHVDWNTRMAYGYVPGLNWGWALSGNGAGGVNLTAANPGC